MSELPTSGSELGEEDTFERLWSLSVDVKNGRDARSELSTIDLGGLSHFEEKVAAAVTSHLIAAAGLVSGKGHADDPWPALSLRWDEVVQELRSAMASLTPRSHAFHMRLASKYADYYRSFDQRALGQWVQAARLKSEFLSCAALHRQGAVERAAELADNLARRWRTTVPVRLPGLYNIERIASVWASAKQDTALATTLRNRANEGVGRSAPYGEDEPTLWRPPRSIENTVRFAFGAATLPSALMA
ncbi:hypothetical protein [Sinorhizobium meliloti]|uniref:hypothetical protein n=1 Tax=Rhizobium meliloti TaxID=382 RepID=UPI003F183B5D